MNYKLKSALITTLVLCIFSSILFTVVYFVVPAATFYIRICNCFFFVGSLVFAMLGLAFVNRTGIFDVVGYSFNSLFMSFKHDAPKKFQDAYHYKEYKKKKRSFNPLPYLPYLLLGGISLIIALVFMLIK
ncbi:MAG: DUF3899 domain-containing protein [Bacilli bacterium]